MDKHRASAILQSIYKDIYGRWQIPHHPKYCNKEVTLSNGEKATVVVEDEVYEFLDYMKKLIDAQDENYCVTEDVRKEIAKETLEKLYNFARDNWDDFYEALYNVCGEIPYLQWLFGLIVDGKELPRKLTPLEELKQYIEYLNKFEEEN